MAGLRLLTGTPGTSAVMAGFYTPGDGGGGVWYWNAASTTGDNTGTIVIPDGAAGTGGWNRIYDTSVNVLWWGADATGASDSTAAFENAVAFLKNVSNADIDGKNLFVPAGYYVISCGEPNSVALPIDVGVHMFGEGGYFPAGGATQIQCNGYPISVPVIGATNTNPIVVETGAAHELPSGNGSGYIVTIYGVSGNTAANGSFPTTYIDPTHFSIPVAGSGAYTSGGTVQYGSGSGISVEPTGAGNSNTSGSVFSNITLRTTNGAQNSVQDLWVAHAAYTKLEACSANGATRFGFINESKASDGETLAPSTAALSTTLFADQPSVIEFSVYGCGVGNDVGGTGNIAYGGGIITHGSDAGAGVYLKCNGFFNNVSFRDGGLLGSTWIACASQTSALGFGAVNNTAIFINCTSEDNVSSALNSNMVIGGTIISAALNQTALSPIIAQNIASLQFGSVDSMGNKYSFAGAYFGSWLTFGFINTQLPVQIESTWSLNYQSQTTYPYELGSWRLVATGTDTLDLHGGPIGWTDLWCPRGPGFVIFGNPLMNTPKRWSYSQTGVTLAPGANIVYPNGNSAAAVAFAEDPSIQNDSPAANDVTLMNGSSTATCPADFTSAIPGQVVQFSSQPGTFYTIAAAPSTSEITLTEPYSGTNSSTAVMSLYYNFFAQTRVSVDVEYANTTDLASGCFFAGYCFTSVGGGRNIASNINNPSESPVTVTLIWHFESFVPNYNGTPVG